MDCCALSIILWNICIEMCELLLVERKRDQLNIGKKNISIVKYCRPRLGRLSSTSTVVIYSQLVYKLTLSWLIDLLYFDCCWVHSNHWALLFTQTFSTFHIRIVHPRRKRLRIKNGNNIWSIVFPTSSSSSSVHDDPVQSPDGNVSDENTTSGGYMYIYMPKKGGRGA